LTPKPQVISTQFPNGSTYFLRILFTQDSDNPAWSLDIFDVDQNPIILGVPLVTGCDLLEQFGYLELGVKMFCTTDADVFAVPSLSNLGVSSHLWIQTS
jgi:hypothetical protein